MAPGRDDTRRAGEACVECGRNIPPGGAVCHCGHIVAPIVLQQVDPADRIATATVRMDEATDPATARFDPLAEIDDLLGGELLPAPTPDLDVSDLPLSPYDLFLYSKIDGERDVDTLTRLTQLGRVELGVLLYNLLKAGAIRKVRPSASAWTPALEQRRRTVSLGGATTHYARYLEAVEGGNPTGAAKHLRQAIALDPAAQLIAELEGYLATVGEVVSGLYAEVRSRLRDRQIVDALTLIRQAQSEFPGEAGFYNLEGIARFELGDLDDAEACVRRAVELDPANAAFPENLARLYRHRRARQ